MTDQHTAQATAAGGSQTLVDTVVKDHPAEHRYEITVAGRLAGFAAYLDRPGGEGGGQRRVFIHTEIDPNYEGQGLAGVLVKAALADVRASAVGRSSPLRVGVRQAPPRGGRHRRPRHTGDPLLAGARDRLDDRAGRRRPRHRGRAGRHRRGLASAARSTRTSFAILEARDAIGGTWDLFRFPGVRSDSTMHTLGLPFRPWLGTEACANGAAICHYLRETAAAYGIDTRIRFGRKVIRAEWSSTDARWTLDVRAGGRRETWTCAFLYSCTGYYDYAAGYTPHLAGADDFRGEVVHLQFWPGDLDVRGRRVAVIGSGATASPSFRRSPMPARRSPWCSARRTAAGAWIRRTLGGLACVGGCPDRVVDTVMRTQSAAVSIGMYEVCRRAPRVAAAYLRRGMRRVVGEAAVAEHFTPRYRPWAQRLCIAPGNDFLHTVADGRAELVTDRIARFVPEGLVSVRVVSSRRTSS